jgi:LEA14-like dessication related protein
MQIGILPIIGIGALIVAALRQYTRKAVDQISVEFRGVNFKLPPVVRLNVFNPTPLKVEVTYIKIQIRYKGVTIADLNNFDTRIMQPGNNAINLSLRPSIEAIKLISMPKGSPRTFGVSYQIGTKLYQISGENQTTI